ncbi:MAG: acyl-ACP--UDP-N-acetylglucosamine O-acyltransferase [Rubrivivax sp.]
MSPAPPAIHPTAIVDPAADLAPDVVVGAYAVIGAGVSIGPGSSVGPHAVIDGPTTIGRDNRIHAHAVLGGAPQDMKYAGEATALVIGDRNTVREFCTFNRGTVQDGGVTRVGDDNWIMAYVHLAHDVQLGHHTILANNATLAGHVHVGDWAIVGGLTGIHQFCHVGAHAMTGFQSHVAQDVPPFMTVAGNPLAVLGVNVEGLRRRGFSRERIAQVRQMYRLLYREGLTLEAAKTALAALSGALQGAAGGAAGGTIDGAGDGARDGALDGGDADVAQLLGFLAASTRGIVR